MQAITNTIKWIGAILSAIGVLCVVVGVVILGIIVVTFGGAFIAGGVVFIVIVVAIKEAFDHLFAKPAD